MRRGLLAFAAVIVAAIAGGCGGGSEPSKPAPSRAGELHQPGAPVVRPLVRTVPVPAHAEAESKGDGRVMAGSASCGRERWAVKTATDPAAANIKLAPLQTTIATLDGLPTTNPGNPDQPRSEAEQQVYKVTATLEVAKREADSDFHLVLREGEQTMIAEIPLAPACTEPPVTGSVSVLETQIEHARAAFVQEFGEPSTTSWETIGHRVTITGTLFFDVPHGQRGVAPNAAELHPVIAIEDP
jgi:hypothetical protein